MVYNGNIPHFLFVQFNLLIDFVAIASPKYSKFGLKLMNHIGY